jgi:hypothetical protein
MKFGAAEQRLEPGRVAKAVPLVRDDTHMALCYAPQLPQERHFIFGSPRRYRQPAALRQRPSHLRCRRRFVRKELQPLLADDYVELLSNVEWQRASIPLAPVDFRSQIASNGEHF